MILIDDRAGSRDLVRYQPLNDKSLAKLTRLDSADVMFDGKGPDGPVLVGVELKSIDDLLSSMETNRLQATQIPAMLEEYDWSYLLWYGIDRPNPKTGRLETLRKLKPNAGKRGRGWKLAEEPDLAGTGLKWFGASIGKSRPMPYGYLHNFLSLDLPAVGVYPIRVPGMRSAAALIGWLHRSWSKNWEDHRAFQCFDRSRPVPKRSGKGVLVQEHPPEILKAAEFASTIPGFGHKTAMAAAKHFAAEGSGLPPTARMVQATAAQWQEVPGVGKTLARVAATLFGRP